MKKDYALKQEDFDALLAWLSANREEAGVMYENIRKGLIRFFRFRGCNDPHTLADETINRVALKVSTFDSSKNVKTITYFYGFASNVFLEYSRTTGKREVSLESEDFQPWQNSKTPDDLSNAECDCLENCLSTLPPKERALIVDYYAKDKSEIFEQRSKLAEELNLKKPALHTKVFRIKNVLRNCIEACLAKNNL